MARKANTGRGKADQAPIAVERPRGRVRRPAPAPEPEPVEPKLELVDEVEPEQEAETDHDADLLLHKPWTVKSVSMEARSAASAAAKRAKQTTGVWLSNAILSTVSNEMQARRGAPAKVRPSVDLDHLRRMGEMATGYSAASGQPPPEEFTRAYWSLMRRALTTPGSSPDPTLALAGPTPSGKGKTFEPES